MTDSRTETVTGSRTETMMDIMRDCLLQQFNETSKRYENYDPKTRSLILIDKLYLMSNMINCIASVSEVDEIAEKRKQKFANCESESLITARYSLIKGATQLLKNEIEALEKYVLSKQTNDP
jgi:hypothetical protein